MLERKFFWVFLIEVLFLILFLLMLLINVDFEVVEISFSEEFDIKGNVICVRFIFFFEWIL